jgi:hypothetical protein
MKRILLGVLAGAFFLLNAAEIKIDFCSAKGPMKPEHGVGQPPKVGTSGEMYHYLKESGIPYSRLHDVGGWHGQNMYVDIPNVFRDFDADENDPASYDFAFTDVLLKDLIDNGVEPYYRLGVTIENFAGIKRMRTFPPKDFVKWARICEHVIRHYTEGWAKGFRYKITYWEIWNEPDGGMMWSGTFEEFCRLYEVASKHLKGCFPNLKIGGYGSSGLFKLVQKTPRPHDLHTKKCVDDFFRYVKDHGCPLDFFSIHAYDMPDAPLVPSAMKAYAKYCRDELDKLGYGHTELSMNEWLPRWSKPGSARQAALCAANLIGLQDSDFDTAMLYDARVGIGLYSPLFDPSTMKPRLAYWALCNFNELYRLGKQVVVTGMPENVYAIAATDGSGIGKLFVANIGKNAAKVDVSAPGWRMLSFQLTDEYHINTVVAVSGMDLSLPADSFGVLTFLRAP